jgi:hypothetical protein
MYTGYISIGVQRSVFIDDMMMGEVDDQQIGALQHQVDTKDMLRNFPAARLRVFYIEDPEITGCYCVLSCTIMSHI